MSDLTFRMKNINSVKDLATQKNIAMRKSILNMLDIISKDNYMSHSLTISKLVESYYKENYLNKK